MAIAHVAKGATQKFDAGTGSASIPLPTGHASGHVLFLFVASDDNTTCTSIPTGWTKLLEQAPGLTGRFLVYARLEVFYRIDTGALGAGVTITTSTSAWPTGNGSVIAWSEAWSGADTSAPIETWQVTNTTSNSAAQDHPQLTTSTAGCWLITLRTSDNSTTRTFTNSVGTDTERMDDAFDGVHAVLYDSNTALAAGLQTVRTTTASGTVQGGSTLVSIAIKPPAAAGSTFAGADVAEATGTAYNPSVATVGGTWGLCTTNAPVYAFEVDWNGDGTYSPVTSDTLSDIVSGYGRDQERQLNPSSVGTAAFDVINVDRDYSPENIGSPLYGDLDPARQARFKVTWGGVVYPLFRGRIDDYDVKADRTDRRVSFTFQDGLGDLQGRKISTGVYFSQRTGSLINTILDLVGWTGGRDIDPGATVVAYWWEEEATALDAVQKLVRSEGPPSVVYVDPAGTFVFRDRHHRLLHSQSTDVQGTFAAGEFACDAPAVTGLSYTKPFVYTNGWRDIINTVTFDVAVRAPDAVRTDVWTSESSISLGIGQSETVSISTSDPFLDAVTPALNTDFTTSGIGLVQVTLSRTAGQSADITLLAVGGSVVVSGLKLRARSIPVQRSIKVSQTDSGSVTRHGERSYPSDAPWAGVQDAQAIANMILLHYAERRPTVQLRLTASDPEHLAHILQRRISDRIHIRNDEIGLDADFFVEKIAHTIRRVNQANRPPVHAVVLGCEKDLQRTTNPFTFDLQGAGFDDGVFDPISADNPATVFVFDGAVNGRFDYGNFGT